MSLNRDLIYRELQFRTSRSGGAGGQHVNKVESKVSAFWDVTASTSITPMQKDLITNKLSNRISNEGILQLDSSESRSQIKNRKSVVERFFKLLEFALKEDKTRRATKVPRSVILQRMDRKKKQSYKKQSRSKRIDLD